MRNSAVPDSPVFRLFNRLGNLILLNLCFVVCCIPVVTIGPACTALYSVCFRLAEGKEKHIVADFFQALRKNFRQGVALWLMLALLCLACVSMAVMLLHTVGGSYWGYLPSLLLILASLIVAAYAFPLLSRFDNTSLATMKNAFLLGIGYLPRTLCILAVNVVPIFLLLTDWMLFLRLSIWGVFLYFSGTAYLKVLLLRKVMQQYLPEETV